MVLRQAVGFFWMRAMVQEPIATPRTMPSASRLSRMRTRLELSCASPHPALSSGLLGGLQLVVGLGVEHRPAQRGDRTAETVGLGPVLGLLGGPALLGE